VGSFSNFNEFYERKRESPRNEGINIHPSPSPTSFLSLGVDPQNSCGKGIRVV